MSIFSGKQYKGAMRDHRDRRYEAAVMRQDAMHQRGKTGQRVPYGYPSAQPAPVEEFLRPGDVVRVSRTLRWVGRQ